MQAQELTDYRLALGFTKNQMGEHLGVTGAAIGMWKSGKNRIPMTISNLVWAHKEIARIGQNSLPDPDPIPAGMCQCGCNQPTMKNSRNQTAKGWVKGEYRSFISTHNLATKRAQR